MPKPDYADLFQQIAETTDPVERAALVELAYDFEPPYPLPEDETIEDYLLTEDEIELFGYVLNDYIENDPGYNENDEFISYIGIYFDDDGNITGIYP